MPLSLDVFGVLYIPQLIETWVAISSQSSYGHISVSQWWQVEAADHGESFPNLLPASWPVKNYYFLISGFLYLLISTVKRATFIPIHIIPLRMRMETLKRHALPWSHGFAIDFLSEFYSNTLQCPTGQSNVIHVLQTKKITSYSYLLCNGGRFWWSF